MGKRIEILIDSSLSTHHSSLPLFQYSIIVLIPAPTSSIVRSLLRRRSTFPFFCCRKKGPHRNNLCHTPSLMWHCSRYATLRALRCLRPLPVLTSPREEPSCGSAVTQLRRIPTDKTLSPLSALALKFLRVVILNSFQDLTLWTKGGAEPSSARHYLFPKVRDKFSEFVL